MRKPTAHLFVLLLLTYQLVLLHSLRLVVLALSVGTLARLQQSSVFSSRRITRCAHLARNNVAGNNIAENILLHVVANRECLSKM